MHRKGIRGFSKLGFILIISIILVVIAIAYFSFYSYNKRQATTRSDEFVSEINNQDNATAYNALSSDLKSQLGSIYSFVVWSSGFAQNNVTIPQTAKKTETNLFDPFHFTLFYPLKSGSQLEVDVNNVHGTWFINDYKVVN